MLTLSWIEIIRCPDFTLIRSSWVGTGEMVTFMTIHKWLWNFLRKREDGGE
uniref:Uncharacterized protein n=1 Tax=Anguilla anguilla TaxID=7936 RepID=A0A0E9RCW7_ANGAN